MIGEKVLSLKRLVYARKDMEKMFEQNYAYTLGKSEGWLV